jgi:hypothetical protein
MACTMNSKVEKKSMEVWARCIHGKHVVTRVL